jgi:hypothetical protein
MVQKYIGVAFSLVLLVLTIYFINRYSIKTASLKAAYSHLSGNWVIQDYIVEKSRNVSNQYQYFQKRDSSLTAILFASDHLRNVVDSLVTEFGIEKEPPELELITTSQARNYFNERVDVGAEKSQGLWSAVHQYQVKFEDYLKTEVYKRKAYYAAVLGRETEQFQQIEQKIRSKGKGDFREAFFIHVFQDTVIRQELRGRNTGTAIEWNSSEYEDYIEFLKQKINSSRALQLEKELARLANSFLTQNKLMLYGNVYDLSDLTLSELSMVCIYLKMEQLKIDEMLLKTNQEINAL